MNLSNIAYLLPLIAAYLIGSIPMGFLMGKLFFKSDIRTSGSGNIGATNALRSFGVVAGVIVLLLDAAKGFLAVYIAKTLFPDVTPIIILTGAMVVIGHVFSLFLRFRGGKGVATAAGVFVALSWLPLLLALMVFILMTSLTRYVSVGSILGAISLQIFTIIQSILQNSSDVYLVLFTSLIVLLIVLKHQSNLSKLIAGNENKISFKKK
ncbi:MAG: acyl-phosphate glycerol 3-phosphate acyltransferase [Candidatus Cloacimonetes bacterium HGW-Cloacimonetes-1]|nr:MAG: acyl-phosphate glycerol 3-phosphate acyltransferase [Candidatus Cloacimonetes bacterium HGW-Cloacimonetes-1]